MIFSIKSNLYGTVVFKPVESSYPTGNKIRFHTWWPPEHYLVNVLLFSTKLFKGQLISKWFFCSSISYKKQTNEFDFTTMIHQVDLFSFVFWRKSTTPKNHFEINWPLGEHRGKCKISSNCLIWQLTSL